MQSELHILVNVLSGRAVWPAGLLENVVLCFCIECGIGCDRISPSMIRVLQGGKVPAGNRKDGYGSISKNSIWSLACGSDFAAPSLRSNPAVEELYFDVAKKT